MGLQADIRPNGLKSKRSWSTSVDEKSKHWLGLKRVPKRIQLNGQWF